MSIPEPSGANAAEPHGIGAEARIAQAGQHATGMMIGAQKLIFEEMIFAGSELMERARVETQLFSEFASKIAAAHSVQNVSAVLEECSKHQFEFVRRDLDRVFQHAQRMMGAAANLLKAHPQD